MGNGMLTIKPHSGQNPGYFLILSLKENYWGAADEAVLNVVQKINLSVCWHRKKTFGRQTMDIWGYVTICSTGHSSNALPSAEYFQKYHKFY